MFSGESRKSDEEENTTMASNSGFESLIDVVDNPADGAFVDKIDTTGDGIADVYTYDNNDDGIADYYSGDTDGDGVTDMQLQDSDFDGQIESGWGEENWTSITDSASSDMTTDDVTHNLDYSLDSDHDGLTNVDEYESGLDASLADTDGDTFTDSSEMYMETDPTDWQSAGWDDSASMQEWDASADASYDYSSYDSASYDSSSYDSSSYDYSSSYDSSSSYDYSSSY